MNRFSFRTGIFFVIALLVFPATMHAQDGDPALVMHDFSITYIDDPDAALALLADDVTLMIVPPPQGESGVWNGIDEAGGYFDFIQQQNAQRELVGDWEVDGNSVSGSVMVTANQLIALGVAPVEVVLDATVDDGKITTWSATTTPEELERMAAAREDAGMPDLPAAGQGGCDDRDCYPASRRAEQKPEDNHAGNARTGRILHGEGLIRHEAAQSPGSSGGAYDIEYEQRIRYLEQFLFP